MAAAASLGCGVSQDFTLLALNPPVFHLHPVAAFADNYLWLLHNGRQALVVDPGDAQAVQAALESQRLELVGTLLTHHHADHVGGVMTLRAAWPQMQVWGPSFERIDGIDTRLDDGDSVKLLGLAFQVLGTPGHTAGHISYFCDAPELGEPLLFCGDTLFSGGCGRLFEGTPAQMHASLSRLAALPGATRVCCAHEYTLSNLKFAAEVDAANPVLMGYTASCRALRAENRPTLPSRISTERAVNPFLRCAEPALQASAQRAPGYAQVAEQEAAHGSEVSTFAALRHWKNTF